MNSTVIRAENISKQYRLGSINHGTLYRDLQSRWARFRGKEDPNSELSFSNNKRRPRRDGETFWALRDLSFEVAQSERLGIIGKNGAGKSTLLKIISKITTPTLGRVKLKGRVASLLEVGTGFHPELTGRENTYLNGTILGMSKKEVDKKFDEIVAFAEIEKFIDTPVKRYSSGMYVRLAFAVAAHLEPEILIVDEVLAVGDAQFQKKCLGKMEEVGKEGRTVLFVSHNMTAISNLCSRLVVLKKGVIDFIGNVDEGIDKYLGNMQTNKVDLNDDDNHIGALAFSRFENVESFNSKNEPTSEFRIGDCLKLKFDFVLHENIPNLEIGFVIYNSVGVRLSNFFGEWEGLPTRFNKGKHAVLCEIPHLYCLPGTYGISPWIKRKGGPVDDGVDYAVQITVVGNDITGFNPDFERYPNLGIYQKSSWKVESLGG